MPSLTNYKFRTKGSQLRLERIKAALDRKQGGKDMTANQVALAVHCVRQTAYVYMAHLHATGQVHIHDHDMTVPNGIKPPIFRLGPGKDKPYPPMPPRSVREKRSRLKRMEDMDYRDRQLAKKRAYINRVRKGLPKPDQLVNAVVKVAP